MSDAFISYRRKPSASLALLVQAQLRTRHGLDAYVDTTRTDSTQVQFPDRLMTAIEAAPAFICLLGETTLDSEWVRKEIQRAYELGKHCIPVFQESYVPPEPSDEAINYLLNFDGVHIFDIKNVFVDEAIDKIAALIPKISTENATQLEITSQVGSRRFGVTVGVGLLVLIAIVAVVMFAILPTLQGVGDKTVTPTDEVEVTPFATTQVAANVTPDTATLSGFQQLQTAEAEITQGIQTQQALMLTATEQFVSDRNATATAAQFGMTETAAYATLFALSATPTLTPTVDQTEEFINFSAEHSTQTTAPILPVAAFEIVETDGLQVTFADRSKGNINTWRWDFGDGGVLDFQRNSVYVYAQPGTYTVTLTVANEAGLSEATQQITVAEVTQPPNANFVASPTSGNATLRVRFTDNSTGVIVQREWNFGDGTTSSEVNPTHDFTEPGTYTVRLTLLGEGDTSDFHEVYISVTEPLAPPSADFISEPPQGPAPLEVRFTNQSSGDNITSRWDFGDGRTSNSQDAVINHTYQVNGTFTVMLTVSGPGGSESVAMQTITVTNALLASFTALPSTNPPGLSVQFTDTSTGNPTSWQWDFGDAHTSNEQNPIHNYGAAGTYTAQLTVSNGQTNQTAQQSVTVNEPPTPRTAAFDVVTIDGFQVSFADRSTGDVNSWQWDFGDNSGVIDIQQNPVYVYAEPGTYTVTLTVSNESGLSQASQQVSIAEALQSSLGFPGNPVTSNALWRPYIEANQRVVGGVTMVMVPVGCFTMGSEDGGSDERPMHEVCFDTPFWIDRTEVTNEQYGSSGYQSGNELPRYPVNWYEAKAHCESRGARLPTEAEWEYAARGPDSLMYPWGNEFVAENVVYFGDRTTAPIASRPGGVSWVGAYDLSGNIWEWVSTIYNQEAFPYPYRTDDRENINRRGVFRVLRGGSFRDSWDSLRAASRNGYGDGGSGENGFRCALSQ